MNLTLTPVTLAEAHEFIDSYHRHHRRGVGHKFSVGVTDADGILRGVAVAGRPKARALAGWLEVTRVCTDGAPNACSMLYGACRRAGMALGYPPQRIITYTLASESGASLQAAGWVVDGHVKGRSWDTPSRPRTDKHPTSDKTRWRAAP